MKRFPFVAAALVWAGSVGTLPAQVVIGPGYGAGYSTGVGFQYKSKNLSVGGFLVKGYGSYALGPYGPGYGPPLGYPAGVIQKNVTINIYPPPVVVAPSGYYDLSGVDLD